MQALTALKMASACEESRRPVPLLRMAAAIRQVQSDISSFPSPVGNEQASRDILGLIRWALMCVSPEKRGSDNIPPKFQHR